MPVRVHIGVLVLLGTAVVTAAALAVSVPVAGQSEPPVATALINGDLEEGDAGPAGWRYGQYKGGDGTWSWETNDTHGGQRALRIRKENTEGYSELESELVHVETGKRYEATAWIKLRHRSRAGIYLMVSQYRSDNETVDPPNLFGETGRQYPAGEWRRLRLRFVVREPNTRVRLHAIVAGAPCDVIWDSFALGPPAPDPIPRYQPPVEETVPSLETARQLVAQRRQSTARMVVRSGRPRIEIDGKRVAPCFYVSPYHAPDRAQIGDFKAAGVRVYLVPLVLGRGAYGDRGPWLGRERYDFSEVDKLLWRVLRVDPQGYVMLYLTCDPYREWGAEHPDEVTRDQHGTKAIVDNDPKRWGENPIGDERYGPSPVSEALRQDTEAALRKLVAHIRGSEPGKAVIGYHIGGSNDGQWSHWTQLSARDPHLADYSPGARRSFQNWLRRLYHDDEAALRRSWKRPDVTFETVVVPAADRCWADRFLIDTATDGDLVDYGRFYSEGIAETVLHLAKVLREATGGQALLGTYYEDISANAWSHIALDRYLSSDALDYLVGPAAYGIRLPGSCGAASSVFGSTLLHGKLYLTEQDWRSWLTKPGSADQDGNVGRVETAAAHNAMVRRESGMMLAYGMGTWWYDMSGGWFRDDQIMAAIAEVRRAFERDLDTSGVPRADLAVFVSEESSYALYPRAAAAYRYNGILRQIQTLNTSGVPYRLYLLSDLGRTPLPEHRVYLFLNAHHLDATQQRGIASLRRDGKLLVFLHAPGIAGAANPAGAIEDVTGIRVRPLSEDTRLGAVPLDVRDPLLDNTDGYLCPTLTARWPAFAVEDEACTAIAHYPGLKAVSVAYKKFAHHQVVLAGCLNLSDQFIANLARFAGAWRVAEPGDAVYANERFLTIHALQSGPKTLFLARPSSVIDLTTGEKISSRTATLTISLSVGETRWFYLTPDR